MMDNLSIYNKVRVVPQEAQKKIGGGRLKGMTDINPMWRIKALTEVFGPAGKGWYSEILRQWIEQGANDEVMAFVTINLYVNYDGEWSKPIPGTGGSTFIAKEKNGLYTSDEAFKMAYTDALSVSCKALGVGADIYFSADNTKYTKATTAGSVEPKPSKELMDKMFELVKVKKKANEVIDFIDKNFNKSNSKDMTEQEVKKTIEWLKAE
jgi:hypothetical protein